MRFLLPTPAWLEGRGGQPEVYCHRQMLDTICYLVRGRDFLVGDARGFPDGARVYAFFRRRRENGLVLPVPPPPATTSVAER
ncbi:hypothetical protein ABZ128_11240 [Streptomyces sp. NPDC006326]|uniref:hypothetical protein n=1 Tax=Streptomyces sp. NPDC006326 TaxID=3156752 RepID=UPI0033B96648